MRTQDWNRQRWVIQDVEKLTVQAVRELAVRHNVRIGQVVDEAVEVFCSQLGSSIGLPDGWRKPRGW